MGRAVKGLPCIKDAPRRLLRWVALVLTCGVSTACGTPARHGEALIDRVLDVLGLQRTGLAARTGVPGMNAVAIGNKETARVEIGIHAAVTLNVDDHGRSLAVVAKIYKLRNFSIFERMPHAAFQSSALGEYPSLRPDIVEVREIALLPGQKYQATEDLSMDSPYIGVVVLFRSPVEGRWRFVFDAQEAAATGVKLGVHGCAMSVAVGRPLNVPVHLLRVAGVHCSTSAI